MRLVVAFLSLFVLACASDHPVATPTSVGSDVTVIGWVRVQGEVMIYETKEAMVKKDQRHCLSGIPKSGSLEEAMKFNERKVAVSGKVVNYWSLPDEDTPVLQRKILNGTVVSDFCLKDEVISIERISPA